VAAAEEPGLAPGTPELRRLNLAMLAAGLAAFSLLYVPQALLPAIGSTFGAGPVAASLTVSVATGTLAVAMLPLSSAAETLGRTTLMRAGLVAAVLLAAVAAVVPAFWLLLLVRAAVGVALGAVIAVAVGHLGDEVRPSAAGAAIGLYVSGNSLGGVVGRLVPGVAADLVGWRGATLVLVGFAALAVAVFLLVLPPARRFTPRSADLGAHLRSVAALAADGAIRRLCLVSFLIMGGFVACYNYLTFRLEGPPIRLAPSLVALLFLAYLAGTVSSPLAGRLADRVGRRPLIAASLATSVVGLLLTLPDRLPFVAVGLLVFTAGFFAAHAVASGWVARRAARARGEGAALYLMGYYLGSSTLGAAIGLAYEHAGWAATAGVIAALYATAALVLPTERSDR
jgi:YNFM family putative membrane transporter